MTSTSGILVYVDHEGKYVDKANILTCVAIYNSDERDPWSSRLKIRRFTLVYCSGLSFVCYGVIHLGSVTY